MPTTDRIIVSPHPHFSDSYILKEKITDGTLFVGTSAELIEFCKQKLAASVNVAELADMIAAAEKARVIVCHAPDHETDFAVKRTIGDTTYEIRLSKSELLDTTLPPVTQTIIIVVMLLAFGIFEVIRINIEAAAIRDKYEDAIIHVSVSNYAKLYQNVREGQAASYSNTGGYVWRESHTATKAQIMQYMNNAMSNGEIAQCTIKNITFSVTPAPRAPGDTSTAEKFSVEGTIEVEIPYDFAWSSLAPMRYTLEVKSEWKAKF